MQKSTLTYIKYPLVIICTILCLSGVRWLISSEPWILDQVANEERLNMTFIDLFSVEGNETLGEYLTQIYRFLGLYVLGIGFILLSFTSNKFLEIFMIRQRFLIVSRSLTPLKFNFRVRLDSLLTLYICDVGSNCAYTVLVCTITLKLSFLFPPQFMI